MKFYLPLIVSVFFSMTALCQNDIVEDIQQYQDTLNEKFANPETTILEPKDFKRFKGLAFYPIDLAYRVEANFVRTPDEKPFLMPTTTSRKPEYVKYGELHFTIDDKPLKLDIFQATERSEEYEDHLFLPFTDATSGEGSYGGGRYIDLTIPDGTTMIVDFNKSYNPYCAYSSLYSCPLTPRQNHLKVSIKAGVKDFKAKEKKKKKRKKKKD